MLICGYHNDPKKVIRVKKPIVLFGDHTREVKLIDFDLGFIDLTPYRDGRIPGSWGNFFACPYGLSAFLLPNKPQK